MLRSFISRFNGRQSTRGRNAKTRRRGNPWPRIRAEREKVEARALKTRRVKEQGEAKAQRVREKAQKVCAEQTVKIRVPD